jgi:hypothetical protein
MQTGPLLPAPLCIHWLRCGLNLYGTRRFYPRGTRRFYPRGTWRFYLYSLAEYRSLTDRRIAFSSLSPPPSELVEVSSSQSRQL